MRLRVLVPVLVPCLALAAACGDDDADGAASGDDGDAQPIETEAPSWLFVVDAEAGTAGDGTLTLTAVDGELIAFSDRPVRRARTIATADFVDSWVDYGFADDPPNAALTAVADGDERTSVVTLSDPAWDAAASTLSLTYDVIDERPEALAAVGGPHEEPAASFERVALFVDSAGSDGPPPEGQATLSDISESEYQSLLNEAQQASSAPCVSGPVTVCTLVTGNSDEAVWTVFAEAGQGVSTDGSATKLTVQSGSSIQYEAAPPVDWNDSRWVQVMWDSPSFGVPSAGFDLDAVVQIGTGAVTVANCNVVPDGDSLTYHCASGS